jgi:hypothetical protein
MADIVRFPKGGRAAPTPTIAERLALVAQIRLFDDLDPVERAYMAGYLDASVGIQQPSPSCRQTPAPVVRLPTEKPNSKKRDGRLRKTSSVTQA